MSGLGPENKAEEEDEDVSRWERMYREGAAAAREENARMERLNSQRSEIRIISFDLDNTVWKTDGCINAANDALATFLTEHDIQQPTRVEVIMKELFQTDKARYSPVLGVNATHATLLTLLRTDAIQKVLEVSNGYSSEDAEAFAQRAFDVWSTARHDAIPHNLASNVIECLESLSTLQTSEGHPILIGAITDGNSDPRRVGILEKYFDFCVNAEGVGVSKPDKRVYLEAVRQVQSKGLVDNLIDVTEDNPEVGPYWVHIGDDFVKDIVAAKDLRMRTIWATQLVQDKQLPRAASAIPPPPPPKTASGDEDNNNMKEFMERISEKSIVEMSIGADDYLADSLTAEFVDAVTTQFHHVADVILGWHAEGLSSLQDNAGVEVLSLTETTGLEHLQANGVISVIMPEPEELLGTDPKTGEKIIPRAFRISREDCSCDVVAPMQDRETRTMREVMGVAQLDKASGVFAFSPQDAEGVRVGTRVLMIKIGGTGLVFSREMFAKMTIQEVLSFTDENPVTVSMYIKEASSAPSFDLF